MDVTVVWAAIIALGLFMYVVLDGFDLGTGLYYMLKLMKAGPALPGAGPDDPHGHHAGGTARRPLSAANESTGTV